MFRNYLKIAIRNLTRSRFYTLINILGLTFGITSFLLIVLYIQHELSYDKHLPNVDKLYRCVEIQKPLGVDVQHVAVTMGPLCQSLIDDFPQVKDAFRLMPWGTTPIEANGQQFNQRFVAFADPKIFRIFGVELVQGDTATALSEPKSVVIDRTTAEKYFGTEQDVLGRIIKFNSEEGFIITGIMKDWPETSHMRFSLLVSYATAENDFPWLKSWGTNTLTTYVLLTPTADPDFMFDASRDFFLRHMEVEDSSRVYDMYLQPVRDIHLKSGHIKFQTNYFQGNINLIYVFAIVAILVIIIACINFINMAIARSVRRSKEVGVRKVLGASRWNLVNQFLGESFIITLVSMIFSIVLVEILLPTFNRILNSSLGIDFVHNWIMNIGLLLLLLVISLVSGSYPAFYLARFQPVKVLKPGRGNPGVSTGILRKALVVFQFTISIALLFSILVLSNQFRYLYNKDLGYNVNQVITLRLFRNNSPAEVELLKNSLSGFPEILGIAAASDANGVSGSQTTAEVDDSLDTKITVRLGIVDESFFPVMQVPIEEGRNFSKEFGTDERQAVILNEAAVKYLQWDDPIGKKFKPLYLDTTVANMTVVGVISDYHYYSLRSKIEPAIYVMAPEFYRALMIRVREGSVKQAMDKIEGTWNDLFPGAPYVATITKEEVREAYQRDENSLVVFSFFTLLSIVISCLGLFGLTSLMLEQKAKEISIRKVLGSSVTEIILHMLKEFMILVLIAGAIATPFIWILMERALEEFAYRVRVNAFYPVVAIITALLIAFFTVWFKTYRSANENPVKNLAYE